MVQVILQMNIVFAKLFALFGSLQFKIDFSFDIDKQKNKVS